MPQRLLTAIGLMIALCLSNNSHAEEPSDPRFSDETLAVFEAAVFDNEGFELPYRLLSPAEIEPGERRPLLLFLHGYGERGDDNRSQLVHGASVFASEDFRRRHGAFVLMPQCPALGEPRTPDETVWNVPPGEGLSIRLDPDERGTPQLEAAYALVNRLVEELPIDPDRVYAAGLSMGGFGTWDLITRHPGRWAAALPICGSGDPTHTARFAGLPVWAFHGDADPVVPVERSREMVRALKADNAPVIYTEYEGVGHDSWSPTFASRQAWDWLFAQRRGAGPDSGR